MSPDRDEPRRAPAQEYLDLVRTDPQSAAEIVQWLYAQLSLVVGEKVPSPDAPKQERVQFEQKVRELSQRLRPARVPIGRLR